MEKNEIKNIGNSDLLRLKKEKSTEFEKVRLDIIKIFDYWRKIEYDYNIINDECKKRKIL
jgi:hypothetical protein